MVKIVESDPSSVDYVATAVLRTGLNDPQRDSLTMMQAATALMEAETREQLELALDQNLNLWVAIRTLINSPNCALPDNLRENLRNLAKFSIDTALDASSGFIDTRRAVSLARIDMNIAEGLLRAEQHRLTAERAYEIWESEGCPDGKSHEHWAKAEQELADITEEP